MFALGENRQQPGVLSKSCVALILHAAPSGRHFAGVHVSGRPQRSESDDSVLVWKHEQQSITMALATVYHRSSGTCCPKSKRRVAVTKAEEGELGDGERMVVLFTSIQ